MILKVPMLSLIFRTFSIKCRGTLHRTGSTWCASIRFGKFANDRQGKSTAYEGH